VVSSLKSVFAPSLIVNLCSSSRHDFDASTPLISIDYITRRGAGGGEQE
jgi:hypothetical protein